ncbi:helix-turn-helix domain-containing protein [Thermaerobacillus caldiproteolyticus]|uniref:helix-turn-helix domain-containing protein n=1 Tax=Thermaerobacillus caldiproteolyticus TaxID=247480 RepID=UPI0018F1E6C7|nr:helix-turn-helix transcriptional regulator [Anoxybacillus caldiproteolyticus]
MIKIKLKQLLEEKDKTMYWLSKNTGIRPNTISQWYNNEELSEDKKVKEINVKALDKICKALDCKIEDILEYVKEEKYHSK